MNVYVPPIIEKVYNIHGSTAAPGSGEDHRYRALRRRERTIAAALEKEAKEKEEQIKFEQEKKVKKEQIEKATLKKKKRREKKNLFKKIKKKVLKKQNIIFEKNIPLIEQVKQEIGKEEFNKLLNSNENNKLNDEDEPSSYIMKPNVSAVNKTHFTNTEEDNNSEKKEEYENNPLKKLFPSIQKKDIEFDNYEDYEDHLTEMKIKEEQEKQKNFQTETKIKQVDEIVFHEED